MAVANLSWDMIAAFAASGAFIIAIYAQFIRPRLQAYRRGGKVKKLKKKKPRLDPKILWGPPGSEEERKEESCLRRAPLNSSIFGLRTRQKIALTIL
ncbi:hypothetical protein AKJ44_02350 [candidate division MSBL1 archaeon SCGC-AAA261F17]|uniref:Uncharacterized protein n=1 Tax=candidate division MSBL1 archaeon SCGC-AAA261F17 TaxID=1698274 RepID=A0A133V5C6_9EURY|nr:hypothetical protein AKJ44_02350 [candidate division MSBL1 archaeon SCGC-AAA261F17]